MHLNWLDWTIVSAFFVITLSIGLLTARQAGSNTTEYFLSGRSMPWWLLGMSMVATTFATDTPNLVTDIVRQNGVAGNWVWWSFLLTGMLTVFVYAKLWQRSQVSTDLEFYELRYSGAAASFLRGFRALYLGVFFNVCIMATVTLAAIKISGVMLNFSPITTILVASSVTVFFSAIGGLRAVILTDCLLFVVAMIGAIGAAYYALTHPEVHGLTGLLVHENVSEKLALFPKLTNPDGSSNVNTFISVLIIPLAVQWWSVWYPGSEPGGGGYVAQRMLSAKSANHAIGATLLFNAAHYALRPWPWILVALASLIVFPDLATLATRFPEIPADKVGHDLAYPAMLTLLPNGLLGLVVASLIAAYMSTISTHLNWGASYVVNDFWKRFIKPRSSESELVWVGRFSTVILMLMAGALALWLENALQAFNILLQIGAGTGLLFILRWFWWRINPYSELTAMAVSFLFAIGLESDAAKPLAEYKILVGVGGTTLAWLLVTLLTPPSDTQTLRQFYKLTQPGKFGWKKVVEQAEIEGINLSDDKPSINLPMGILCMLVGCFGIYSTLFATGYWIYGQAIPATVLTGIALLSVITLSTLWPKVTKNEPPSATATATNSV